MSHISDDKKESQINGQGLPYSCEQGWIVHVAAEVAPFSKKGGLGDVLGSLPRHLSKESGRGNIIFSPYYDDITGDLLLVYQGIVDYNGIEYEYHVLEAKIDVVICYFIRIEDAYSMESVYADGNSPYLTEVGLFYFIFGKSVIDYLTYLKIKVGALVSHDWHATGVYPYLGKLKYFSGDEINTMHVIHNYQHQGEIYYDITEYLESEVIAVLEKQYLDKGYCTMNYIGIMAAKNVVTVSPTYAYELSSKIAPHAGLDLLSLRNNQLYGILNGIDDEVWDPSSDVFLTFRYDAHLLERKRLNKDFLLQKLKLTVSDLPLVVFISRLTNQKGIDLFVDVRTGRPFDIFDRMESFLERGLTLVICGTPNGGLNGSINQQLTLLQNRFPDRFSYLNYYTEEICHQLLAAADILIQPSRFEPCGLTQMYAMKYGAVPIVTPVGGLKDSVNDYDSSGGNGTGFLMKHCSFPALCDAFDRALKVYRDPVCWTTLIKRCMAQDNSWSKRVGAYLELLGS